MLEEVALGLHPLFHTSFKKKNENLRTRIEPWNFERMILMSTYNFFYKNDGASKIVKTFITIQFKCNKKIEKN